MWIKTEFMRLENRCFLFFIKCPKFLENGVVEILVCEQLLQTKSGPNLSCNFELNVSRVLMLTLVRWGFWEAFNYTYCQSDSPVTTSKVLDMVESNHFVNMPLLILPFFCVFASNRRQGHYWPGRDWLRKDGCFCAAYPPIAAFFTSEAPHSGSDPHQRISIPNFWAVWSSGLQHWCQMWYVSVRAVVYCELLCSSCKKLFIFISYFELFSPSVAAVIVGGIDMMSQSLVLAKKPHVVIGKSIN